VSQQVLL
jgi:hypothetical protein